MAVNLDAEGTKGHSIGFSSRNLSSGSSLISRAIFKFTHYIYPLFLSMVLRYRSILNIELHCFRKKNFLRWHNCDDMQATFLCVQAQFFKYILKFVQLYLEIVQIHFSGRHSPSKCLSSPPSPWFIFDETLQLSWSFVRRPFAAHCGFLAFFPPHLFVLFIPICTAFIAFHFL